MSYERQHLFVAKSPTRPESQYVYSYTTTDPIFNTGRDSRGYDLRFSIEGKKIIFNNLMSEKGDAIVKRALLSHNVSFDSCVIDPMGWVERRILTNNTDITYGLDFVSVAMKTSGAEEIDIEDVLLLVKKDLENNKNWCYELPKKRAYFIPQFKNKNNKNLGFFPFEIDSENQRNANQFSNFAKT
jgi:hypothetical protein